MYNSKFILGTAQLNQKYGISNFKNKINYKETKKILSHLIQNNYKYIDTANNYNDADKILGKFDLGFSYFTKISPINNSIIEPIENSLKSLNIKSLEGFFFHDLKLFLKSDVKKIYREIEYLKSENKLKSFGFSLYDPDDLQYIHEFQFDLLQIPINFADRRFCTNKLREYYKENNLKIFARSIFLQGLLLMSVSKIPKYFDKWNSSFIEWFKFLKFHNIDPIVGCILFIKSLNFIDFEIFGITSYDELIDILSVNSSYNDINFKKIFYEDEYLVNPSKWKL